MYKLGFQISLCILIVFLITEHEAVAPLFLQAITSALATIPFTGGPMTTGLVGAKLGIGTKLLYYLGYFGRRSKPVPKKSAPISPMGKGGGSLQAVPLPYVLSGGGGFQQMGGGFGGPFTDSNVQQMGGGFGGGFQESPFGGIDPAQVFAALRAQGYDPNTAMQLMNYGNGGDFGMGGGGFMPNSGFEPNTGNFFPGVPQGQFNPVPGQNFPSNPAQTAKVINDESFPNQLPDNEPEDQEDDSNDIESFFTFLSDMDQNSCISRLVCDIGSDPSFLGEFSENIHNIVGSLDVQQTSRAYPYIQIMETGRTEGGCETRFPQCSDSEYEVVKNVAPSVGVPQNVNSAAIDQL